MNNSMKQPIPSKLKSSFIFDLDEELDEEFEKLNRTKELDNLLYYSTLYSKILPDKRYHKCIYKRCIYNRYSSEKYCFDHCHLILKDKYILTPNCIRVNSNKTVFIGNKLSTKRIF